LEKSEEAVLVQRIQKRRFDAVFQVVLCRLGGMIDSNGLVGRDSLTGQHGKYDGSPQSCDCDACARVAMGEAVALDLLAGRCCDHAEDPAIVPSDAWRAAVRQVLSTDRGLGGVALISVTDPSARASRDQVIRPGERRVS